MSAASMMQTAGEYLKSSNPNVLRALQLVRYELRCALIHLTGKVSPRQRFLIRSLRGMHHLKLNIASGEVRYSGWINVDLQPSADICMDLRSKLPLRDSSVAFIFCEHFCDYLNVPSEIMGLLREFVRVLEPDGRVRIVLQDGRKLMESYLDNNPDYFSTCDLARQTKIEFINELVRSFGFRHFLYDFETFEKLLKEAGFARVCELKFGESEYPELVLDHKQPIRQVMSMYIEASK